MVISSEDMEAVQVFADKKNKGLMVDSKKVAEVYNRIMYPKQTRPSNCGGCIKRQIQEMEAKVNQWKKALELKKEEEEAATQPIEEEPKTVENKPRTKGVAKKSK